MQNIMAVRASTPPLEDCSLRTLMAWSYSWRAKAWCSETSRLSMVLDCINFWQSVVKSSAPRAMTACRIEGSISHIWGTIVFHNKKEPRQPEICWAVLLQKTSKYRCWSPFSNRGVDREGDWGGEPVEDSAFARLDSDLPSPCLGAKALLSDVGWIGLTEFL